MVNGFFRSSTFILIASIITLVPALTLAQEEQPSAICSQTAAQCQSTENKEKESCLQELCSSFKQEGYKRKLPLLFRDNYFLYTHSNSFDDGRKEEEVKFQLSFQTAILPVLSLDQFTFVVGFAYSQKSFWQVTDENNSRPFRETNYNPEGFILIRTNDRMFSLRLSPWEHESNGREEGIYTRSWDRYYMEPGLNWNDQIVASLKIWARYKEKECEPGGLSKECDENPDLEDYTGNFEFRIKYKLPAFEILGSPSDFKFTLLQRRNFTTKRGAHEIGVSWKIFEVRAFIQYWNGYAESLIDYRKSSQRWGIGFMLEQ